MFIKPLRPNSLAFTIMLAGLSALPPLCIDMNLPAIPEIESALGVDAGRGALTFSLFLLGFALAPVLGGPISDRFGRKPSLLISLVITAAAALACALSVSFDWLLFFRLIQGLAAGTGVLVPLAIVRDALEGDEARSQLSKFMLVMGLAPMVAPMIGSWMLVLAGWRSIYGVQAGMGVALLVFVALGFKETLPRERRVPLNPSQMISGYKTVLGNRTFLGFALTASFGFGCLFSYISGSPGLILGKLGLSELAYSLIFALTSFGVMLGSFTSNWLVRRGAAPHAIISTSLTVMALAVVGALCLALLGVVQTYNIVPAIFIALFCFGLIVPNAMAGAVEPLASIAGTASGTLNSLQMLTGSAASALVTFLAGFFDPALAMTVAMACAMIFAAGVYFGLGGKRESDEAGGERPESPAPVPSKGGTAPLEL